MVTDGQNQFDIAEQPLRYQESRRNSVSRVQMLWGWGWWGDVTHEQNNAAKNAETDCA